MTEYGQYTHLLVLRNGGMGTACKGLFANMDKKDYPHHDTISADETTCPECKEVVRWHKANGCHCIHDIGITKTIK